MAFQTVPSRDPAGHGGLIGSLLALVTDFALLVEARMALFVRESKSALVQMIILAGLVVAAVLFVTLGYIFLLVSVIFGVAELVDVPWIWIALIAAGVHFLLALICIAIAWTRLVKPPYRVFAAEIRKDREWLRNLDQTSRPNH